MASNAKVSVPLLSVLWTAGVPGSGCWGDSKEIAVGDGQCFLQICKFADGSTYGLCLSTGRLPSSPLQVTAYLSKGTELFLPQTTMVEYTVSSYLFWKCTHSEMSKVDPSILKRKTMTFRIIVHSAGQMPSESKLAPSPVPVSQPFHLEALSRDFGKLLVDGGESWDVQISCGGQVFKAHRCVLSVRSEVFAAMLQSNMAESETGKIQIKDVEEDVFRSFLRYLYTGVLPELTTNSAQRLYEVADKYAVSELRKACSTFLCSVLTKENACDLLVLSDRHSDRDFKDAIVQYMVDEKIPRTTQNWPDFCDSHPRLANEVLNWLVEVLSSK